MKNVYLQMIELVRRVLQGDEGKLNEKLFPDVNDIEMWKELFTLALAQEVQVFLYESTKNVELPEQARNNFYSVYNRAVRKEAIMHLEISKYFQELDKAGITYLPIKGWKLKNLYEKPYLRTMTDVDVIVREDGLDRACEIAKECEFEFQFATETHNVFVKKPVTELEIHQQLFSEQSVLYQWSKQIFEKNDTYEMSKEDTYIYLFAHMAKHFNKEGAGMRNMIDCYLFNKKYSFDEEQRSYIDKVLKELELDVFENRMCQLTKVWFENGEYDEATSALTEYILDGGLYGKVGNTGTLELSSNSTNKFKWAMNRLFPDFEFLKTSLNFKKMYKPLTPVYWIIRMVRGLFRKGRISAMTAVLAKSEAELEQSKKILEYAGINKTNY